ncbi:glycerol-3-phosphate dehydrogenase subunit GlpB [Sansalvadorimonas verongulae]|uniref:glycerol-3-phosphate dehydrogenase subunit GlpB n=1 Tax=Sansalvadorimonas verongulae TaxID=2172824 RepID=UPI0012BBF5CC|nr:glycerol-3-phosphate dehydrogenase subunit GlpB [Sansalvadorimonas verongulae]MTI13449.1 glycerol-3-phosphate dehydrogenase subunit GlpB [Sansalvadorimonas verongulae]
MKHDCLVIGGGLAGLTAGIRCAEAGLKVAVISAGECALTFASGSLDVLGRVPGQGAVRRPFEAIDTLAAERPEHPYSRLGGEAVAQAMGWFHGQMAEAGLALGRAEEQGENQWRMTAAGALRPTYYSQPAVQPLGWEMFQSPDMAPKKIVFVNITGFLDFMPELAARNLKQHPSLKEATVEHMNITLPLEHGHGATADTMRAPQLAYAMGNKDMDILSRVMAERIQQADLVVLPACFDPDLGSEEQGSTRLQQLRMRTGLNIIDVAALPPSVHGLRMHQALRNRFRALGGFLVPGTQAGHGMVKGNRVISVSTGEDLLFADHFILASGSFFSRGLDSKKHEPSQPCEVKEPVFGLDLYGLPENNLDFSSRRFLAAEGQSFTRCGVALNEQGNPSMNGLALKNLHVAGAVLGGYDPVQECSGGGVAISTGWEAAQQVINQVKKESAQ